MTKREAKQWAYGMAAALLTIKVAMGGPIEESDLDYEKKKKAMDELIEELRRRSKEDEIHRGEATHA